MQLAREVAVSDIGMTFGMHIDPVSPRSALQCALILWCLCFRDTVWFIYMLFCAWSVAKSWRNLVKASFSSLAHGDLQNQESGICV